MPSNHNLVVVTERVIERVMPDGVVSEHRASKIQRFVPGQVVYLQQILDYQERTGAEVAYEPVSEHSPQPHHGTVLNLMGTAAIPAPAPEADPADETEADPAEDPASSEADPADETVNVEDPESTDTGDSTES